LALLFAREKVTWFKLTVYLINSIFILNLIAANFAFA